MRSTRLYKLSKRDKYDLSSALKLNRIAESALSYADLAPYTEKDFIGLLFLATNIFFYFAGLVIYTEYVNSLDIDLPNNSIPIFQLIYSSILDIAGIVSSAYHFTQLRYGQKSDIVVRILIVDYIVASLAISTFLFDLFSHSALDNFPQAILLAFCAIISLLLSWIYEYGLPYIVFHGLWHILSAFAVISMHSINE